MNAKPRGSTILYVLLLMLLALLIAMTVAGIVLRNQKVASSYNQSAHSFYAAESGLERSLFYLQTARARKTIGLQGALASIYGFTETVAGGASYTLSAIANDTNFTTDLPIYQSQQWDIFGEDYYNGYHLIPLPLMNGLRFTWNEGTDCVEGNMSGNSAIEIAFSPWTQYTWEDISDPTSVTTRYRISCPGDASGDYDCSYSLGVDSGHLYKVRVKALECDLVDVGVTAMDGLTPIPSYNEVILTSSGQFSNSQRTTIARLPWEAPLQEYFDFVIFSEDAIIKWND